MAKFHEPVVSDSGWVSHEIQASSEFEKRLEGNMDEKIKMSSLTEQTAVCKPMKQNLMCIFLILQWNSFVVKLYFFFFNGCL